MQSNPLGHNFQYREYEGWDLNIGKQICGITDKISYLNCRCECGWSASWKTQPWNYETGRQEVRLTDNLIREIRDAHDQEIGLVTTW